MSWRIWAFGHETAGAYRNGKAFGAIAAIAMSCGVFYFAEDLANWKVDSHVWSREHCAEGGAQRAVLDALVALRDDAPPSAWCEGLAADREGCEEDPEAWFEEVVRPVALEAPKCLRDGERAEFVGGGATPHDLGEDSKRFGARSELICEGVGQRLEVITSSPTNGLSQPEKHGVEGMRWVAAPAE
jgi:hypothetical protein